MQYPYLLYSDVHCHSWSQYAKTNPDGVNSRLAIILSELKRAYKTLSSAGGSIAFDGGDTFHIRGKIEPSVFNPTFSTFEQIHKEYEDIDTTIVVGNHDLEGKNADEIGNSMQTLSSIYGITVATKVHRNGDVIVVPWYQELSELRAVLRNVADDLGEARSGIDVIIHAPVNGILKGIPDHGLEAGELAALGFRRVFAGHYHNHVVFEGGKVVSIGATTHQTWNDVDTKAGFLLVYEDRIEHFETLAPRFIDMNALDLDDDKEIEKTVSGNYVRLTLHDATEKEVKTWRSDLTDYGALGVSLNNVPTKSVTRSGTVSDKVSRIDESVANYIQNDLKPLFEEEVTVEALDILREVMS